MNRILFIVLVFIGFNAFAQVPGYVSTFGLISWWSFTGNANDGGVNGNNGVVYGATLTADHNKIANSAYDFSNDSITIANAAAFSALTTVSVSAWIKTTVSTPKYQTVFSNYTQNGLVDKGYWLGTEDTHADFWLGDGANSRNIVGKVNITDGLWHLLTGVFDGKKGYIYVDGKLDDSVSTTFSPYTSRVCIGNDEYGEYYTGSIDDVGVWRRALSEKEISNLFTEDGTGIHTRSTTTGFSVYPNPAAGNISIRVEETQQNAQIQLFNAQGMKVDDIPFSGNTVDITRRDLPAGVYVIRYISNGILIQSGKLILQ